MSRIYQPKHIANILRGVAVANTDTGARREGFISALIAVGFACGLVPVQQPQRREGQPQAIPAWTEAAER